MANRAPTRMADATYGVWFPVPKKSAVRGYTILSPKSLDSPKRRKSAYTGINASRASKILTVFKTRPNLLMSEARRSVSGEGKTLVQKFSPLPKLILSRRREEKKRKRDERGNRHGRYGCALHVDFFRRVPELAEDAQRVGEGGRTALDTVIDIRRAALSRVHIHGACHAACDRFLFKDSNHELVRVFRQGIRG